MDKKIEIELIPIQKGLEKIAGGGWYLDRYRSSVIAEEEGLPNDLIYIVNDETEAKRRYDPKINSWVTHIMSDGK